MYCGRVVQKHGDIRNRSNNSIFNCENLLKLASVWSHPHLGNLNEAQRAKVNIYRTNTVTSSRTLLKSHKVFQKDSSEAVLEKSYSEKFHKEFTQKKLLWSPFFSYLITCNFTENQPHHSYFPMTFEKTFQNTVLCQNTSNATEELKYLSAYVLVKSWSEEFHKIHPKETKSSFLVKWQLATPSQLYSYVTEAIRVCLKHTFKIFKISIN